MTIHPMLTVVTNVEGQKAVTKGRLYVFLWSVFYHPHTIRSEGRVKFGANKAISHEEAMVSVLHVSLKHLALHKSESHERLPRQVADSITEQEDGFSTASCGAHPKKSPLCVGPREIRYPIPISP